MISRIMVNKIENESFKLRNTPIKYDVCNLIYYKKMSNTLERYFGS